MIYLAKAAVLFGLLVLLSGIVSWVLLRIVGYADVGKLFLRRQWYRRQLYKSNYVDWRSCYSCGGYVVYRKSSLFQWLVHNNGGYTKCLNCGTTRVVA